MPGLKRRISRIINQVRVKRRKTKFVKEIGMKGMHSRLIDATFGISRRELGPRVHARVWIRATRDTGAKKIRPFLTKLLEKEKNPHIRASILNGLALLGDKQALLKLVEMIKGLKDPWERMYAILYLPSSAEKKVIDLLQELKEKDSNFEVRVAAQVVLREIRAEQK